MDRKAKKETTPQKKKMIVDCLKITEDKSSESRVQTPYARLIIATATAPRREGQNSCLNITAMTKTRGSKLVFQHHCSSITTVPRREGRNPRLYFTTMTKTQSLKPAPHIKLDAELEAHISTKYEAQALPQPLNARLEARVSTRGILHPCYNCPHY